MPPVTRNQAKKASLKQKPYCKITSKQNEKKRTPLLDLIPNKDVLAVSKNGNNKKIKKQIENLPSKSQSVIQPSTNNTHSPCNISKESTFYQSVNEELISSDELYHTAIDITHNSEFSETFYSATEQLSINCCDEEIFEIDLTNWNNFMYVGCYARNIFNYLRKREDQYIITDYINNQSELTRKHRAIVVNWLVSLQDVFELNHEVLYLAVKLMDLYLMKRNTLKKNVQLIAASALLLSSKIDVQDPGFAQELHKEMSNYTETEFFIAEKELAITLNFDLNVPLSYVFLRRFARCMKCQMILLTLARYILECSLLEYNFVTTKDSLKAASSLYLAFKMNFKSVDAIVFEKYTGYTVKEIKDTVFALNNTLHTQSSDLLAIKQKYTHEVFYKVAKKTLLSNSKLTFD